MSKDCKPSQLATLDVKLHEESVCYIIVGAAIPFVCVCLVLIEQIQHKKLSFGSESTAFCIRVDTCCEGSELFQQILQPRKAVHELGKQPKSNNAEPPVQMALPLACRHSSP